MTPEFGARPVKRAIQRYLLNDLIEKAISTGNRPNDSHHSRCKGRATGIS